VASIYGLQSTTCNTVLMSWGKQQDVVAAPTDDQVKIVQHITSKDAQVRGCGIGKTCELTVNSYQSAIIMEIV
jgi:hypothetical protein